LVPTHHRGFDMDKKCVVCSEPVATRQYPVGLRYAKTCGRDECKSEALKRGGRKNRGKKHSEDTRANMSRAHRQDNSKYIAAHMRVRRLRGSASEYICPCGRPAVHWAFQWRITLQDRWMIDPGSTSRGGLSLYSLTESDYEAMCGRCASWYDRADQVREFYEQHLAGGSDRQGV